MERAKTLATFVLMTLILSTGAKAQAAVPYLANNVIGQPSYTTNWLNGIEGPNDFGFKLPEGIALDATNHLLFVADTANNRVLVFQLSVGNEIIDRHADYVLGQASFSTSTSGTTQSTLNKPTSLAVSSSSSLLFVVDSLNNRVLVFDYTTLTNGEPAIAVLGQANYTANAASTTQSGLNNPYAVTLSQTSDMLFVTDTGNSRVMIFDIAAVTNNENAVHVLGKSNFTDASAGALTASTIGQGNILGIAVDESGQRLFVSDGTYRRVLIFDVASISDGESAVNVLGPANLTSFGSSTAGSASVRYGSGLTFAPETGYLYVSERSGGMIKVFDVQSVTNGESAIRVIGRPNFTSLSFSLVSQTRTNSPIAAAYDSVNKKLFSVDKDYHRVLAFDVATITDGEAATDGLGQLYENGQVKYDNYWSNGQTTNSTGVFTPWGIVTDEVHHKLYVSEESNSRVMVFNLSSSNELLDNIADYVIGQTDLESSMVGTTQSSLSYPQGLAFDKTNRLLFVADTGNNRVLVFDTSNLATGMNASYVLGQSDFTSSSSGLSSMSMDYVTVLTFDNNHQSLFATDYFNNRIMVFDTSSIANGEPAFAALGQPDFTSTEEAVSSSRFGACCNLSGLAYDHTDDLLFVSDQISGRILVFDGNSISTGMAASNVLGQPDFTNDTGNASQTTIRGPGALAVDETERRLYALDLDYRLLGYDISTITNGEAAVSILGQPDYISNTYVGQSQSSISDIGGLAFDSVSGNLFISETYYDRVLSFGLIRISTTSLVQANVLTSYIYALSSINSQGTVTYSLVGGVLPAGLLLSSSGVIYGIPTVAGTYNVTIRATDDNGSIGTFTDTKTYALVVNAAGTDTDQDGVIDSVEASGPNSGDANGDNIQDATQVNVATNNNSLTSSYTTIQSSAGAISGFSVLKEANLPTQNNTLDFPVGLNSFTVSGLTPGATSNVVVYYDKIYDTSQWTYMKYNASNGTYLNMNSIVTYGTAFVGGTNVTTASYSLVDGGIYDEDGVANGVIVDPAGPSMPGVQSPNTGIESINTTTPYILISLALILFALHRRIIKK